MTNGFAGPSCVKDVEQRNAENACGRLLEDGVDTATTRLVCVSTAKTNTAVPEAVATG